MRRTPKGIDRFARAVPIVAVVCAFGCYESIFLLPGGGGAGQEGCDTCEDLDNSDTDIETDDTDIYSSVSRSYTGVDLLIVEDTSYSMQMTISILPTYVYSLVNRLTAPLVDKDEAPVPAIENLKVALATADMGLQTGENGDTSHSPNYYAGCDNLIGDNGEFQSVDSITSSVPLIGTVLECAPENRACPEGFYCTDDGFCAATPGGDEKLDCTDHATTVPSTSTALPNGDVARQIACTVYRSSALCGFEQTLESMLRSLETHPTFIDDNHVLAVVIVSDENDCSIEDHAMFSTPEWLSEANIACNATEDAEAYLFPPTRYRDRLRALKGGRDDAVVFSAIVGVPLLPKEDNPCEGTGAHLSAEGCLARPEMAQVADEFMAMEGASFIHFRPACSRETSLPHDPLLHDARPGRRFVETAQAFGRDGMVFSICRADWSDTLERIAEAVSARIVFQ